MLLENFTTLVQKRVLNELISSLILDDALDTRSAPGLLGNSRFNEGRDRTPRARVFRGVPDQPGKCRFTLATAGNSIGGDIEDKERSSCGAARRRITSVLVDSDGPRQLQR